jgi:hypothetical protein
MSGTPEVTNLSGGEVVGLEGGSPKHHKMVKRADGTHYFRRTASAIRRNIRHHKDPMKRSMKRKSSKKRSAKKRSSRK